MGKIRRGGYLFVWWAGDHPPRHVHVFDGKGRLLGRVAIEDKPHSTVGFRPKRP